MHSPPNGGEAWAMAAQAAAAHGVGLMAVSVGIANLEPGANPDDDVPERWDLLHPQNRANWDEQFEGEASSLFSIVPGVNRMAAAIAEKRLEGDPSVECLPPKVVTHASPRPGSGTWTVEDSWISPADDWRLVPTNSSDVLRTGYACHGADFYCSGFGRIKFNEMKGAFDATRVEEARLLLTLQRRQLAPSGDCDVRTCNGNTSAFSHVSRIPSADSLNWGDTGTWEDFIDEDSDPLKHRFFNHVWDEGTDDEEWYQDFGLQYLSSARRDYIAIEGIWDGPDPSHRIVDFDLTNLVRYWASEPDLANRNNGIFIQPYSPTRRFEPHLFYVASFHEDHPNDPPSMYQPSILVYELSTGTPKDLGAPFSLFYEAPPGTVRLEELAHRADEDESWLVAINSTMSSQCLRIYSNGHPDEEGLDVYRPMSGEYYGTVEAAQTRVDYINFDPTGDGPDFCPALEDMQFGIDEPPIDEPWFPDQAESYQPITRWDLTLQPSFNELSAVLIRVPHPQPQS